MPAAAGGGPLDVVDFTAAGADSSDNAADGKRPPVMASLAMMAVVVTVATSTRLWRLMPPVA
jgi:hypothetical protein